MVTWTCPRCGREMHSSWDRPEEKRATCIYCGMVFPNPYHERGNKMRALTGFIGKNREFAKWLAAQKQRRTAEVIYLQRCELCGQLAKGAICRKCEPLFRRWTKKIATEMAAEKKHPDPSIA